MKNTNLQVIYEEQTKKKAQDVSIKAAAINLVSAIGDDSLFALLGIVKPEIEEAYSLLRKVLKENVVA